jgi:hypothetical protein
MSAMLSEKKAEVVDDAELSSSPRPSSSDRVEAEDRTDVTGTLDVVRTDHDGDADETMKAAMAAVSRYSAAEAAAAVVLLADDKHNPDSSTWTCSNDDLSSAKIAPIPPVHLRDTSSSLPILELQRNPRASRPVGGAVTALTAPEQYRLHPEKLDAHQNEDNRMDAALLSIRSPGAYQIAPRPLGNSSRSSDQQELGSCYNDTDATTLQENEAATYDLRVLFHDPENALEAHIVPERDLKNEVTKRMEAMTIDAQNVQVSRKDRAPQLYGGVPKSVIKIIVGVCLMALLAVGSAVGIKNRKGRLSINTADNENESEPNTAPTFLPDLEFARTIFAPLSGDEALLDELPPQYKALWWIVHEDPANVMTRMTVGTETQSSSSSLWMMSLMERYTMALLYFSTDGPNWVSAYDFLGIQSICDWGEPIQCSEEGAVNKMIMGKPSTYSTLWHSKCCPVFPYKQSKTHQQAFLFFFSNALKKLRTI